MDIDRTLPGDRAWRWLFVALGVAICAYVAAPSIAVRDTITVLSGCVALGAVLIGTRTMLPIYRPFARLLAASVAASLIGDMIWGYLEVVVGEQVPLPSPADVAYLAAYPLMIAALLRFPRPAGREPRTGVLLDCALVMTAVGTIAWEFLFQPNLASPISDEARLVGAAYPALGVLVVALLFAMRFRRAWSCGVALLACGELAAIASDCAFALSTRAGTYLTGMPTDIGWLVMYCCFGAAALHPSFRREPAIAARPLARFFDARVPLLFIAALIPVAVTCGQRLLGVQVDVVEFALESIAVLTLVFARLWLMTRSLQRAERERRRQNERLLASSVDRQRLMREIVGAAERETTRLSGELHDGPVQRLAALGYLVGQLEVAMGATGTDAQRELTNDIAAQLSSEIHVLRHIMQDLRPPSLTQHGLASAIESHARAVAARNGWACRLAIEPVQRLEPHHEAVLYRIAQEALVNITKHADARTIDIRLFDAGGMLRLAITDDGSGFDEADASSFVADRRFGMAIMRERAESLGGSCVVRSRPGRGTTVTAFVPTSADAPDPAVARTQGAVA